MMDKHLDVMTMVAEIERPASLSERGDIVWRFDDKRPCRQQVPLWQFP